MIPLRIFLHGLILLVPGPDTGGGVIKQLTAYLVNATSVPEYASGCVHKHSPALAFYAEAKECTRAGCQSQGPYCTCSLQNREIALEGASASSGSKLLSAPPTALPTKVTAGDFSYIINLFNLGLSIDLNNLNGTNPTTFLIARMSFPFDSLTACRLALHDDSGTLKNYAFNFRSLGTSTLGSRTQALAQALIAEAQASPDTTNLVLKDFTGTRLATIPLRHEKCEDGQECFELWLTNPRDELPPGPNPCDDGKGRDFAFVYEILDKAANQLDWDARPVPQVTDKRTGPYSPDKCDLYMPAVAPSAAGKDRASAASSLMLGMVTVISRPVCPMAVYYQP